MNVWNWMLFLCVFKTVNVFYSWFSSHLQVWPQGKATIQLQYSFWCITRLRGTANNITAVWNKTHLFKFMKDQILKTLGTTSSILLSAVTLSQHELNLITSCLNVEDTVTQYTSMYIEVFSFFVLKNEQKTLHRKYKNSMFDDRYGSFSANYTYQKCRWQRSNLPILSALPRLQADEWFTVLLY